MTLTLTVEPAVNDSYGFGHSAKERTLQHTRNPLTYWTHSLRSKTILRFLTDFCLYKSKNKAQPRKQNKNTELDPQYWRKNQILFETNFKTEMNHENEVRLNSWGTSSHTLKYYFPAQYLHKTRWPPIQRNKMAVLRLRLS